MKSFMEDIVPAHYVQPFPSFVAWAQKMAEEAQSQQRTADSPLPPQEEAPIPGAEMERTSSKSSRDRRRDKTPGPEFTSTGSSNVPAPVIETALLNLWKIFLNYPDGLTLEEMMQMYLATHGKTVGHCLSSPTYDGTWFYRVDDRLYGMPLKDIKVESGLVFQR